MILCDACDEPLDADHVTCAHSYRTHYECLDWCLQCGENAQREHLTVVK